MGYVSSQLVLYERIERLIESLTGPRIVESVIVDNG